MAKAMANSVAFYRKMAKLTQQQVAEKVTVSRPTVSLIENGRIIPDITLAQALAACLGVTLGHLYTARQIEFMQEMRGE
jgi:putative transcriptional regulator